MTIPSLLREMMAQVGGEVAFNRGIFVSEDLKFAYFNNPIAACSSIKASLHVSLSAMLGIPYDLADGSRVHRRDPHSLRLLRTPNQMGYERFLTFIQSPETRKFSFVRSPHQRLLSAFEKKLTYESPFTGKVRRHLSISDQTPLHEFLTFERFLEFISSDEKLRDLDEHWRLQRKNVYYDLINDLDIGLVENYRADFERIFSALFGVGNYEHVDMVAIRPINSSKLKKKDKLVLTPEMIRRIDAAYGGDLRMIAAVAARADGGSSSGAA